MTFEQILCRFPDAQRNGTGWKARCPAHDDKNPSLSISEGDDGRTLLHCHAGCSVETICACNGLTTSDLFSKDGRRSKRNSSPARANQSFNWQSCVDAFTNKHAKKLAEWRGLSLDFVRWLHAQGGVGLFGGKRAFPVQRNGEVVGCHYRIRRGMGKKPIWSYFPKGTSAAPLLGGDVQGARRVLLFESQWDAFAVMDKLRWHAGDGVPDTAVFITRGAGNSKLVQGQFSPKSKCYAFAQNDMAGQKWLGEIAAHCGCMCVHVVTPEPHKDANDWTRAGATRADIKAAIKAAKPFEIQSMRVETDSADIRGEIVRVLLDGKLTQTEQRTQIANAVVKALAERGKFFFHTERKDFDSAMYFDGERKQLLRVRADNFLAWLAEWLAVNRADAVFKFIAAQVETSALAGDKTTGILPESYWASRSRAIYLSNGDGEAVKITPGRVETVDNGSDGVLFAAGNTLAKWQLTEPENPFDVCRVFGGANCAASHGLDLLTLWILSLPTNPASKPPLVLTGDIGSGKTRLAKGVAELYGLPFVANKVEDFGEDSFWASLDAGGLFTLDNADTRNKWLSDAVASAATDGCSQRRKLYTNSERVTLRARAWLCLTSANPTFANDSGLADRLILVRMNRRTDETSDAALSAEIQQHRNAGLSFIAHTLAAALADAEPTPGGLNQRHPDFAAFGVRIGRAIKRENESISALKSAEQDKSAFCVENDFIGTALLSYLDQTGQFTGKASDLRDELVEFDTELDGKITAKGLGKRLNALWPHLEKVLDVAKQEKDRLNFTFYKLKSRGRRVCRVSKPAFTKTPIYTHT